MFIGRTTLNRGTCIILSDIKLDSRTERAVVVTCRNDEILILGQCCELTPKPSDFPIQPIDQIDALDIDEYLTTPPKITLP